MLNLGGMLTPQPGGTVMSLLKALLTNQENRGRSAGSLIKRRRFLKMFYCYNYYRPHAWIRSSVLGPKLGLGPFKPVEKY